MIPHHLSARQGRMDADGRVRSSRLFAGREDLAQAGGAVAKRILNAMRAIHLFPLSTAFPSPTARRIARSQPVDRGHDRASREPPESWVLIERGPQMHNLPTRRAFPHPRR